MNQLGSDADAVVIAKFVDATATPVERWVTDIDTTLHFTVQEVLKNDPRVSADGLAVVDTAGGGGATISTRRVL